MPVHTVTSRPDRSKLRAMPEPMIPVPSTATRVVDVTWACYARRNFGRPPELEEPGAQPHRLPRGVPGRGRGLPVGGGVLAVHPRRRRRRHHPRPARPAGTGAGSGRPGRCTSTRTRCCTGSAGSSRSAAGRWPRPNRWPRCGWPCAPRRRCPRVSVCSVGFVPDEFVVPRSLVTDAFWLEPLKPEHNEGDYRAWTASISHIRATPGFEGWPWPRSDMTLAENLGDLPSSMRRISWPGRDSRTRCGLRAATRSSAAFTFTRLFPGLPGLPGPRSGPGSARTGPRWIVVLYDAVSKWLRSAWPFTAVRYAPR